MLVKMITIKTIRKVVSRNEDRFYWVERNVCYTFLNHEGGEKKTVLKGYF